MVAVTAKYVSPTHSLDLSQPINSSESSQRASLEALRQAILSMQSDLNVFLTARKLEEDRASGVNGTSTKRKARDDEEDENEDEDGNEQDE